jgi:hypothetical protein
MYLWTGFSTKTYAEDTSGYIVGTYITSDQGERKSQDKKNTSSHRGCGWLAPKIGSKY